jgi:hypothetical protein
LFPRLPRKKASTFSLVISAGSRRRQKHFLVFLIAVAKGGEGCWPTACPRKELLLNADREAATIKQTLCVFVILLAALLGKTVRKLAPGISGLRYLAPLLKKLL